MMTALALTPARKLRLFQNSDPHKWWYSIDEIRFCARCEHPFIGRDIKVFEDGDGVIHFRCPTYGCKGGFDDWQYPQLHL